MVLEAFLYLGNVGINIHIYFIADYCFHVRIYHGLIKQPPTGGHLLLQVYCKLVNMSFPTCGSISVG